MADVISRSIPALPYAGGAIISGQPTQSAVRLTDNRMIWTWCQSNPNWRFFTVVDTPEGWANGGTPAVTVNRMFDQRVYGSYTSSQTNVLGTATAVQMYRLNDNAWVLYEQTGLNGVWIIEIFEIDADNVITKTWSNLDGNNTLIAGRFTDGGGNFGSPFTKYDCHQAMFPLADNKIQIHYLNTSPRHAWYTLTYDPATKTPTFSSILLRSEILAYSNSAEIIIRRIPNSTRFSVHTHSTATTITWTATNGMCVLGSVFEADGTLVYHQTMVSGGTNTTNMGANGYLLDSVTMGNNRYARVHWGSVAYFKADNTPDGFCVFNNTTNNNAMMAYALDNDYLMLVDRTHFVQVSPAVPLRVKIVRRDDSTISTQSTGSNAGATGFDVTATYIDTWRHEARPRKQANGDLFWWGLDSTGTKLSWNILKNAS